MRKLIIPKKKSPEEMTLRQFIQNPTGKGSALVARRDLIKANLADRFRALVAKYGEIQLRAYKAWGGYVLYFRVPSEEFGRDLIYDAVLLLLPGEFPDAPTLENWGVRLFSNSPNFTFTYAYVLYNTNMMIDELSGKVDRRALTEPPKVRNPVESLGFEKSCYFSALSLLRSGAVSKVKLDAFLSPWDERSFSDGIATCEEKLLERRRAGEFKAEKAREKRRAAKEAKAPQARRTRTTSASRAEGRKSAKEKRNTPARKMIRRG